MLRELREWNKGYIGFFFVQAEDGIRDETVTGVQTCALPISIDPQRPTTLYAGSPRGGVFKSADAEAAWSRTSINGGVTGLAIDPQTPTTLYAIAGLGISKDR